MEPYMMNAMNENLYRAVMTLIEGITMAIGLASLLFILLCIVSALGACFAEMIRPARRQKPSVPNVPEPDAQAVQAALACLDKGFDSRLTRRGACPELAQIQQP